MKKWIQRSLIAVMGAVALVGGLTACSRGSHGPMTEERITEWRGKAVERVTRDLELDAQQKQRFDQLTLKLQEQRKALIGTTTDPRAEFQALIAGPQFDRSRANSLVQGKTQALQSGSPEVVAALADFYDSLNPTQQQKVRDFLGRRHGHWGRG